MAFSFSLQTDIGAATDPESQRAIHAIQVMPTTDNGMTFVAATDSRVLAVAQVDGTSDETALVMTPKAATIKKVHRVTGTADGSKQFVAKQKHHKAETLPERPAHDVTVETFQGIEGKFPRYIDVIPDFNSCKYITLEIDPQLLLNLHRALTGNDKERKGITLLVPLDDDILEQRAVAVSHAVCAMGKYGIGAIMPMATGEEKPELDLARFRDHRRWIAEAYAKGEGKPAPPTEAATPTEETPVKTEPAKKKRDRKKAVEDVTPEPIAQPAEPVSAESILAQYGVMV